MNCVYLIQKDRQTGLCLSIIIHNNTVTAAAQTGVVMYYGNSGASDTSSSTAPWDANYLMVQHHEEASGTITDSTTNGNDGSETGGVTYA